MARSFNGSSDYITAGNAATPNSLTMACWVNSNDAADASIISKPFVNGSWTNPFIQYRLDITSAKLRTIFYDGILRQVSGTTSITAGTWVHAGATLLSSSLGTIYFNGISENTVGFSSPLDNTNVTNLCFGVRSDTSLGEYLNGKIAEIGIWNVALTAAEMAVLAKGYSPAFIRPASLTGYWPLLRANIAVKGIGPTLNGTAVLPHPRILMSHSGKQKYEHAPTPPVVPLRAQIWM